MLAAKPRMDTPDAGGSTNVEESLGILPVMKRVLTSSEGSRRARLKSLLSRKKSSVSEAPVSATAPLEDEPIFTASKLRAKGAKPVPYTAVSQSKSSRPPPAPAPSSPPPAPVTSSVSAAPPPPALRVSSSRSRGGRRASIVSMFSRKSKNETLSPIAVDDLSDDDDWVDLNANAPVMQDVYMEDAPEEISSTLSEKIEEKEKASDAENLYATSFMPEGSKDKKRKKKKTKSSISQVKSKPKRDKKPLSNMIPEKEKVKEEEVYAEAIEQDEINYLGVDEDESAKSYDQVSEASLASSEEFNYVEDESIEEEKAKDGGYGMDVQADDVYSYDLESSSKQTLYYGEESSYSLAPEEPPVKEQSKSAKESWSVVHTLKRSLGLRKQREATVPDSSAGESAAAIPATVITKLDTPTDVWNDRFQTAVARLYDDALTSHRERQEAYAKLASLAQDFAYTAETYGRIIITEVAMPPERKTVKPSNLGGIVGGDKYLCHGVLFKFAIDSSGVLQSDESAMKIASHELKSLDSLFSCRVSDLYFPLLALVDFRGYRLIALSQLPVGRDTLMFGSSDGGKTIRKGRNTALEERINRACASLNLKEHAVGPGPSNRPPPSSHHYTNGIHCDGYDHKGQARIVGPIDLEGHVGKDGRSYVLDFSRLFPPCLTNKQVCCHLFQLFRPEFVRKYDRPLCSDGFSKFVSKQNDAAEHRSELRTAMQHLVDVVVPELTDVLAQQKPELFSVSHVIDAMHRKGINVRFIGLIRSRLLQLPDAHVWSDVMLLEMLARVIKWKIRSTLRKTAHEDDVPAELPYKEEVARFLNLVFGASKESVMFWECDLFQATVYKFSEACFSKEEHQQPSCIRERFFTAEGMPLLRQLFDRIVTMVGVRMSPHAHASFTHRDVFSSIKPFDVTHVESIQPVVKHVNLLEHAQASVLKQKALGVKNSMTKLICSQNQLELKHSEDLSLRSDFDRLCRLAIWRFERALSCNPSNKHSLRSLADLYAHANFISLHNEKAAVYYSLALDADEHDPKTLYKIARFKHDQKQFEEAEEFYLQTIEESPSMVLPYVWYALLLSWDIKESASGLAIFLQSIEIIESLSGSGSSMPMTLKKELSIIHSNSGCCPSSYEQLAGLVSALCGLHHLVESDEESASEAFAKAWEAKVTPRMVAPYLVNLKSRDHDIPLHFFSYLA